MASNLLRTKYQIPPPRAAIVDRPRLLALLNEPLPRDGVWQRKLTLLAAPAGYGKSTLLSAWSAQLAYPVAWLTLDAEDNDPLQFLAYLTAALQTVDPGIGAGLRLTTRNRPTTIRPLLVALANDIAATTSPFALILDDYHQIEETAVHELVSFLIEQQPPQCHLLIATRADPPLPLPRLRGQGMLAEVRLHALRFTGEEAATFFRETMTLMLTDEEAETLVARTEGWIAGLQLAALALHGRPEAETAAFVAGFSGTHRYVLDYLLAEVLQRQSEPVQLFLLQTSILERLSAPLCDALLHGKDNASIPGPPSWKILSYLDTNNLFLVPLDEQRCWYRYHQLFASLLRARLQEYEPERVPLLHRRASRWFERAGMTRQAIDHAFAGNDAARAALLVEKNAAQLVNEGQLAALDSWIEALPPEVVANRPWLSVFRAWSTYWSGSRNMVEEQLQRIEEALAHSTDLDPMQQNQIEGHLALLRAHKATQEEDVDTIVAMAEKARALLPRPEPSGGFAAELTFLVEGIAAWGVGNAAGAEAAFRRARLLALEDGWPGESIVPASYEALQQIKQGRLPEARRLLQTILESLPLPVEEQHPARGFAYLRLGDIAREWNRLDRAHHYLEKGIALCQRWGLADAIADGHIMVARLHFAQGDPEATTAALATAEALLQTTQVDPFVSTWFDACRLRLWIYRGEFEAVRAWLSQSELTATSPLNYLRDLDHLNLALALVTLARHEADGALLDRALRLLRRLLDATRTAGWVDHQIRLRLLQALALETDSEPVAADGALTRALALAEPGGYFRCFLDEGGAQAEERPLLPLLYRAVEQGNAYAGRLLRQMPQPAAPTPLPHAGAALVEPLSARELDVLGLIATGLSNREIALQLAISLPTVKWHASNVYGKLAVGNRTEAVARARALGLLS